MRYEYWEPLYHEICEYFSFDPAEDERAAHVAADLSSADATSVLVNLIAGHPVTVCGNAPCLKGQVLADKLIGMVIAADAAASVLLSCGVRPAVIVTDLDGIDEYAIDLNNNGTILVVHAHGDNIPRIKTWVPKFSGPLILTTQGRPFQNIHNFGGFSDGDRAVYMARDCGASEIHLLGFDCDDQSVTPVKKGKLIWARRLLSEIGYDC
ncbi:MAG TPA: 6-hydroxymethylpterin diphosphokinase MptE-like protein [Methanospirillum sp.]|uniref:6-hydroxymethylpterin diphosphokinase MptE-like protein n=1 Tax=Methanospirillum sp. TaxID=45200 RepID=UPI002D179363|nr:6-hydroxymethylpterin diphosphokinase MptE-like protein [Methanospirillum sp.]HWQ64523.1 6-hydroxymethylpterin diphosphokinase MptE-like protein [Methanospirillum sp.]